MVRRLSWDTMDEAYRLYQKKILIVVFIKPPVTRIHVLFLGKEACSLLCKSGSFWLSSRLAIVGEQLGHHLDLCALKLEILMHEVCALKLFSRNPKNLSARNHMHFKNWWERSWISLFLCPSDIFKMHFISWGCMFCIHRKCGVLSIDKQKIIKISTVKLKFGQRFLNSHYALEIYCVVDVS